MPDLLRCALPDPDPDRSGEMDRPRITVAATEAIQAARKHPRNAAATLRKWFRSHRQYGSKERPLIQDLVYTCIRHEHLLIRAGARSAEDIVAQGVELIGGNTFPELEPTTPAEDYAVALSIDYLVAREWLERLGPEEAAAFGKAQSQPAPTTLRAQPHRCTRDELQARLQRENDIPTTPTDLAPHGLIAEKRAVWAGLDAHREGWFEVQDESSQLFVEAIDIQGGESVLDLCAGAGGKALAFASQGAQVLASDIRPQALRELERRARRGGLEIDVGDPRPAEIVVVDAPCSGTGRLRRDPALRWGLEAGAYVDMQRTLLEDAAALVLPGGRLAYATCSLLADEQRHDLDGWSCVAEKVLWPHREGTDGFSWQVFVRAP